MDFQKLIEQAQTLQSRMREEMESVEETGEAGGGMVRVTLNGAHVVTKVHIDPAIFSEGDAAFLAGLVQAAANDAARRVEAALHAKVGALAPMWAGMK